MTSNQKYELLKKTHRSTPERIGVASDPLEGIISNGNAPIHAFVIDDGNEYNKPSSGSYNAYHIFPVWDYKRR